MKVVFISNFMSHHQLPLSQSIEKYVGVGNYTFVATKPLTDEYLRLGYPDINREYEFILCAYGSEENKSKAKDLIFNADVVIWGDAAYKYLEKRLDAGKLTFCYSERIFRNGTYPLLKPSNRASFERRFGRYRSNKFYLLATGAYCAKDFSIINAFPNKALKWGYFPPFFLKGENIKKDPIEIVWCARFIALKHPEAMIYIAEYLRKRNINFHITMIGDGELLKKTKSEVESKNLGKYISFTGSVKAEKVRAYMDKASVFLFTSDKREGWGAVLNEAMNSGCVPVVSHEIGAVPFLVEHKNNGFIFKSKNWKQAALYVEKLLNDTALCNKMSQEAYSQIADYWNAEKAVKSLFICCEKIQNGEDIYSNKGPLSKAPIISMRDVFYSIRKE